MVLVLTIALAAKIPSFSLMDNADPHAHNHISITLNNKDARTVQQTVNNVNQLISAQNAPLVLSYIKINA